MLVLQSSCSLFPPNSSKVQLKTSSPFHQHQKINPSWRRNKNPNPNAMDFQRHETPGQSSFEVIHPAHQLPKLLKGSMPGFWFRLPTPFRLQKNLFSGSCRDSGFSPKPHWFSYQTNITPMDFIHSQNCRISFINEFWLVLLTLISWTERKPMGCGHVMVFPVQRSIEIKTPIKSNKCPPNFKKSLSTFTTERNLSFSHPPNGTTSWRLKVLPFRPSPYPGIFLSDMKNCQYLTGIY